MATKQSLKDYVHKLETINHVEIVQPNITSPWNNDTLQRLFRLIREKLDDKKKHEFIGGWNSAFSLDVLGWYENVFYAEDVQACIPFVFRMIEIVENELPTTVEMALYLKENLFYVKSDVKK